MMTFSRGHVEKHEILVSEWALEEKGLLSE